MLNDKNEKAIARKIVDCCHNGYFCAHELLAWLCNNNSTLFSTWLRTKKGSCIKEMYFYNKIFSDEWNNVVKDFLPLLCAIMPELEEVKLLVECEWAKRERIKEFNEFSKEWKRKD